MNIPKLDFPWWDTRRQEAEIEAFRRLKARLVRKHITALVLSLLAVGSSTLYLIQKWLGNIGPTNYENPISYIWFSVLLGGHADLIPDYITITIGTLACLLIAKISKNKLQAARALDLKDAKVSYGSELNRETEGILAYRYGASCEGRCCHCCH